MGNKVCAYLSSGGVAVVGFSTALSGYRFHDRGLVRWFVSDMQEALATSTHDVQKMIDYLQTRNDIDTSRIGIFGQGSGAAIAILAASVDPRIKLLDLEDTWGDWPDFLKFSIQIPEAERATYLKPEFLQSLAGLDPLDYLPKLTIPVRNQYSMPKSAVPPEARKRIEQALPPQATHLPIDNTFDWIKGQLNGMGK
jgi:cephalosporin-C deacetylase-like acetyl esterase